MRTAVFAVAAAALMLFAAETQAQFVYVAGYAPAPAVYAPPATTVVYRPVAPVVSYSPVVAPPVVAAPVVAARPVVAAPVVTTRYRPLLGRSVTRVRYGYAPAFYAPVY